MDTKTDYLSSRNRKPLIDALESKHVRRRSFPEYRNFIRNYYDGMPGALTAFTGWVTGHETLAGWLIRSSRFDVRGCKRILDAACGNGRYSRFLLRRADADAQITAFDLSLRMLRRARRRLHSPRVSHVVADLTRLPYPDGYFDAIVCGWVLEHLPDPRPGLRSLSRVLQPGGKLLLLATEDTFNGALTSKLWHCRTYNRKELLRMCNEAGLHLVRELWFSQLHRLLKLGGIIIELKRE
jgi:ubiquinone/menaquinone biosynthesis C-methylase UbiE